MLAACVLPARAETAAADTVATELKEVVVKSERAWVEGDKIVFIPNKREKNLSNSPATLLKKMNLPTLYVENDEIKSRTGKTVDIFINGVRAEATDIATFWPKQAKRVEYMENPKDPRFQGSAAVVNFIMTEYEVGGVTRIDADQYMPNEGSYEVASKLVVRKMTYGLLFNGGYSRDHNTSYQGEDNYNGIYYGGDYYDNVKRGYEGHSWSRKDNISAGFSARYVNDKFKATHNVSLLWTRNPGSGSYDAENWSPSLFSSESAVSGGSGRSISPQFMGQYDYITSKWSFTGWWNYVYAHDDRKSMYRNGELDPVLNSTDDDNHTAGIGLFPSYRINDKFSLYLDFGSWMSWFTTRYIGSANTDVDQRRSNTKVDFIFYWQQSNNLSLTVRPGLRLRYWEVDKEQYSRVDPACELSLWWGINRKLNLSANLWYNSFYPTASHSGDVMVKQNELEWLQGNPALHNESRWNASLFLTWLPANWLNFNIASSYIRENDSFIDLYSLADPSLGGIVKTYSNGSPVDTYTLHGNISARFFDSNLSLSLSPQFTYTKAHGKYADELSWFRMRGSVSYDVGNCSFGIWYGGTEKWIDNCGMVRSWNSDSWDFMFSYGNGNLYLDFRLGDIFNTKSKSWKELRSDVFTSMLNNLTTGRSARITLTYTFGYGKQVDKRIDVVRPSETESGALGI